MITGIRIQIFRDLGIGVFWNWGKIEFGDRKIGILMDFVIGLVDLGMGVV